MVEPKKRHVTQSPTNYWLLLAVKILLVVLILLWLAPVVYGKTTTSRKKFHHYKQFQFSGLRTTCQNEPPCANTPYWECQNHIHRCMSETCFADIYADNLLEDGEIDFERAQDFKNCVMRELVTEKNEARQESNRQDDEL